MNVYVTKGIDHRKIVRFGFVTSKPKLRKFQCSIITIGSLFCAHKFKTQIFFP